MAGATEQPQWQQWDVDAANNQLATGAMDGATATQRRQRWTAQRQCERGSGNGAMHRVNGKWRRTTQGEGNATKGDATTSHRSEREANERRKAQADKRRRGDDEEEHVVLLSGGGGSAVPEPFA